LSLNVQIRPVSLDDLPSVAALDRQAFGDDAYVAMTLRQFYDLAGSLFLVAVGDEEVVGYALVLAGADDDRGCFVSMAVAPEWRRRGVGQLLMTDMLGGKRAKAFSAIWLTVEPKNKPAIRLAENFDFVVTHEDPDYFGNDRTRLVMTRQTPVIDDY